MEVAILTVGDELLSGDTENTNATWLARQVTARGATVTRILVVPDDRGVIADYVRQWADRFDAVVVTGGLGGTHDDVTMDAVADALGRDLVVDPDAKDAVICTAAEFRDANPELVDAYDLDLDVDAWASVPEGARVLENEAGLAPGCAVDADGATVYVTPGIPAEMKAVFETVADEFGGDVVSERIYTPAPEGAITDLLAELHDTFDVAVGSYPSEEGPNSVKVTGTDLDEVSKAVSWLEERLETVEPEDAA
ncbi:competence/damage-inducible protein A [Halospeciosus flavus]|uniref:Competence/damage-inducible protein A n=1 Tax=Halospeciosus flavus TaxID=3032283 RepID=A0ABD5Z4H7_9EURY|nr:molybdopterin-binding protein [Halospeciosus flavus]